MKNPAALPDILFVTLALDRGGTEGHLTSLLPRLKARGWPVSICLLNGRGALTVEVERNGIEIFAPPLAFNPKSARWIIALQRMFSGAKLALVMLRRRPHIVHFFLPAPYLIGAPVALFTRRPICIMSRRNLNQYQFKRPLAAQFEMRLHRYMTAILANSERIAKQLREDEAVRPEKIHLIRNGVDLVKFRQKGDRRAARASLLIEPNAFAAVIVANLIPYKGHADLIHAMALVAAKMPTPWVILCVGRDDGCQADLEQLRDSHGLTLNIRFLGARADVPDVLAAADVGLLCSHEEGFSNAIIEGMAAGLPMIVTDAGGNPEAVRHAIDGLVVPTRDPGALGNAILTLALDAGKRSKMGASAHQRARDCFSLESSIDAYDRFYRSIVSEGTSSL